MRQGKMSLSVSRNCGRSMYRCQAKFQSLCDWVRIPRSRHRGPGAPGLDALVNVAAALGRKITVEVEDAA